MQMHKALQSKSLASSKNTEAIWLYNGDLKAKARSKFSQVVDGVGPALNSHVVSRWSNNVLSDTLDSTFDGSVIYTCEVYLQSNEISSIQSRFNFQKMGTIGLHKA